MDLRNRFEGRALWMAGIQLALLVGLLIYGLMPLSLGSRLLVPGLVMTAVFSACIWMTLHRPWTWKWGGDTSSIWLTGRAAFCDGLLIAGATYAIVHCFVDVLTTGKERLREALVPWDERELIHQVFPDPAWAAWLQDTSGVLLISGPFVFVGVVMPLAALALLWLFLPR